MEGRGVGVDEIDSVVILDSEKNNKCDQIYP